MRVWRISDKPTYLRYSYVRMASWLEFYVVIGCGSFFKVNKAKRFGVSQFKRTSMTHPEISLNPNTNGLDATNWKEIVFIISGSILHTYSWIFDTLGSTHKIINPLIKRFGPITRYQSSHFLG